jgi:hypothetical protein
MLHDDVRGSLIQDQWSVKVYQVECNGVDS